MSKGQEYTGSSSLLEVLPASSKDEKKAKSGYKHTSLGWIPEGWEVKKLGEMGKLSSGTTPLRQRNEDFFLNGTIPWVKTTDLNNSFINKTEECVTRKALEETSLKQYSKGTILVAMYGGFNQIGRTGILNVSATFNQALTAICLEDNYVSKYVMEYLNYRVGYWKKFAGSSRKDPNITGKDVADFPVIVPSFPEQRKIASILSTWDEAIVKTQQLITQLKQRNKGLMQQLLSGKKRLKGFNGEWKKRSLSEISIIKKGKSFPSKYLKVGNYPVIAGGKTIPYFHNKYTDENVVTISASGAYAGFVSYHHCKIWASDCIVLSGIEKESDIIYLFYLLLFYQTFIYSLQSGGAQPHIYPKDIRILSFNIPIVDEQKAIDRVLDIAFSEVKYYKKRLATLQQQKKGLMQKLLTGEIRVQTNN